MTTAEKVRFKSPLQQMALSTPTSLWNDSASIRELTYSLEHGAVGATCNPVIVLGMLQNELADWAERLRSLNREMSASSEDEISWRLVEEISAKGALLLRPVFHEHNGKNGRLSIQTDPRLYRNSRAMLDQALHFHQIAPNMIVKIPATRAGIVAIEEATCRGVSVNATVSFTLPQAVAVAEAFERGLRRREAAGGDISTMGPVCTIMVGRLDDWMKVVAARDGLGIDPQYLEWAGVAVFKKAYRIFRERGYRTRLLAAAFRNEMHWSEFIGGDVVISPPHSWQLRFNASDLPVIDRIGKPVDPNVVRGLEQIGDFRRAYMEDGMSIEEFDTFGATVRTLRQFIGACSELNALVRDFMLPDPDRG